MFANRQRGHSGFTLLETVLVIAILTTFLAVQLPAVQRARDAAAKRQTENQLKQLGLSLHVCADQFRRFPPAWGQFPPAQNSDNPRATLHYWLLPYLEGIALWQQGQPAAAGARAKIWDLPKVYKQPFATYISPMDPSTSEDTVKLSGDTPWGVCNFGANTRVFGGLKKDATADAWDAKARFATIADGTANTIAFATRYAVCGDPPGGSAWAGGNTAASLENFTKSGPFFGSDIEDTPLRDPGYAANPPFQVEPTKKDGKNPCNPLFAHAFTAEGIQVCLFDGSVRTVSARISPKTWGRACHPSDGNILDNDW